MICIARASCLICSYGESFSTTFSFSSSCATTGSEMHASNASAIFMARRIVASPAVLKTGKVGAVMNAQCKGTANLVRLRHRFVLLGDADDFLDRRLAF